MQLQSVEILMCQQKHYTGSESELWDFYGSFLQTSEQENRQERLRRDGPVKNTVNQCGLIKFNDLLESLYGGQFIYQLGW